VHFWVVFIFHYFLCVLCVRFHIKLKKYITKILIDYKIRITRLIDWGMLRTVYCMRWFAILTMDCRYGISEVPAKS